MPPITDAISSTFGKPDSKERILCPQRITMTIGRYFVLCCVCLIALLSEGRADPGGQILEEKLGGSFIKISIPSTWNKNVLILAHGLRSPDSPLSADFTADKGYCKVLSDEGWLIASTSYRKNGYIIQEAIEDLEELRRYVAERFGAPRKIVLNGASMGGAIVTLMAEADSSVYAGALVIGPALGMDRNTYRFKPAIPVLVLTNQNERADPDTYGNKAGAFAPALWTVKRDGHCNVTSEETLAALRALVLWMDGGPIELEKDGTMATPAPVSTAVFAEGGARAKIVHCASSRGSFDTQFTTADMEKLGIPKGGSFTVTAREKSVQVRYGSTYSDVPKGDWIAFIVAETGLLRIGRNYADAVTELGGAPGDMLTITPPASN